MSRLAILLCIVSMILACGVKPQMTQVFEEQSVEVSPGKWLPVALGHMIHNQDLAEPSADPHSISPAEAIDQISQDSRQTSAAENAREQSLLSCEWGGQRVTWQGAEIPVTLREFDSRLFLIGMNRDGLDELVLRLVFFAMDEVGSGFERIPPGDFPRQIATQNMWMRPSTRFVGTNDGLLDKWELLRNLDVGNRFFASTLTARMWYQIESNREEYLMGASITHDFVLDYADRYHPIALPTISMDSNHGGN